MQYAHLGKSGVVVSRLCLGTMNFGSETTEQDSFAIAIDGEIFQDVWFAPIAPDSEIHLIPAIRGG